MMETQPAGTLILIGGYEDKHQEHNILHQVAQAAIRDDGLLVIITAASSYPEERAEEYTGVFMSLGVKRVDVMHCATRDQASDAEHIDRLRHATVAFLTGGDQVRLTSMLGGSLAFDCLQDLYTRGGTIAGTSAGAAAMSSTMLFGRVGAKSHALFSLEMAPGLGFLTDVVIDSHFAERGRLGRLLGAVAQNPRNLGLGIDEDTALVVQGYTLRVIGKGAVYVIDGSAISFASVTEERPEGIGSIYDVKLHILAHGASYDLQQRRPLLTPEQIASPPQPGDTLHETLT
jgi:cyanophycinase